MRRVSKLELDKIEEIAKKVMQERDTSESSDGTLMLFDEGQPQREARIAFSLTAMDFPTRDALEKYKKDHPAADPANLHVVPTKETPKAPQDPSKQRTKGKPEEVGKSRGKPEDQKPQVAPTKEEIKKLVQKKQEDPKTEGVKPEEKEGPELDINEKLVQQVGKGEAKDWNTHSIHKSQLTKDLNIKFPDGSSKKYKDLDDSEKQRVDDAIAKGQVAHKGMNDYTKVDMATLKGNMARNLGKYDDKSVEETKNDSQDKVSKDNIEEFSQSFEKNVESVFQKYDGAMSNVSRPMAKNYASNMLSCIKQGVEDGSLKDVSQADLDAMVREDVKRLIHQEIETRGRSLGDHGIRHCTANAENSMNMLSQLQEAGSKITGKDKLMAMTIQANHDIGYTTGQAGVDVRAKGNIGHQHNSGIIAKDKDEQARYAKVFGKDSSRVADIIETHDTTDIDWDVDPVASSVRLSDSIALFGKDKVQDL